MFTSIYDLCFDEFKRIHEIREEKCNIHILSCHLLFDDKQDKFISAVCN